jgi:predicted DNA-binding ribbon-helix-helix protein
MSKFQKMASEAPQEAADAAEPSLSQRKRDGTVRSVHVLLDARVHRLVKHIATARDSTMSVLIAEAVDEWLARQPERSLFE